MKEITVKDIEDGCLIDLGNGFSVKVSVIADDASGAPWKEEDGHGKVIGPVTRSTANLGEVLLWGDRWENYFYNTLSALDKAKREGWWLGAEDLAKLELQLGRKATADDIAFEAVQRDIAHLRGWLCGDWRYLVVIVKLLEDVGDGETRELASDALGRVDSLGEYWKECACNMVNGLIEAHVSQNGAQAKLRDALAKLTADEIDKAYLDLVGYKPIKENGLAVESARKLLFERMCEE